MEEVRKTVLELRKIRKVPQFFFHSEIHPGSMIRVREEIDRYLESHQNEEIDFILNSPGGVPDDAYRIIRTLRKNFKTVNIVVPFWAKSAATLLALGGSNIIMDEFGEFGPLDIQIAKEREDRPDYDRESALNDEYSLKRIESRAQELFQTTFISLYSSKEIPINRNQLSSHLFKFVSDFYEPQLRQINPYKVGEKKRKLEIGEHYAKRILALYNPSIPTENRNLLVNYLVNECPDHGTVIDFDIMNVFLPNTVKSSIFFGIDYSKMLKELSFRLINDNGDLPEIAEFIEIEEEKEGKKKKKSEKQKSEPSVEEMVNNAVENHLPKK